jgi:hypothetical protein
MVWHFSKVKVFVYDDNSIDNVIDWSKIHTKYGNVITTNEWIKYVLWNVLGFAPDTTQNQF